MSVFLHFQLLFAFNSSFNSTFEFHDAVHFTSHFQNDTKITEICFPFASLSHLNPAFTRLPKRRSCDCYKPSEKMGTGSCLNCQSRASLFCPPCCNGCCPTRRTFLHQKIFFPALIRPPRFLSFEKIYFYSLRKCAF
jgi:hypothetical protein